MTSKQRRTTLGSLALLTLSTLLAFSGQALAQNFPTKPIKLIIPHAVGAEGAIREDGKVLCVRVVL